MTALSSTLQLACDLIARPSVTPEDSGCQPMIAERLAQHDFSIQHLPFGDVHNLWAVHGTSGPILCLAGHTDVVPTGPVDQWHTPPFEPSLIDGLLYGRGSADMKGALAAMITAAERFVTEYPEHPGRVAFLLTSDEEGPAINGTVQVMNWLQQQAIAIDWCIVGEPSSSNKLGDTIKHGRRGSLNGQLTIHGKQGHIAYPHLADNPIPTALPALAALCATPWDQGNEAFVPTSFQISNVHAGTGAGNVIPGTLTVQFNFRFSTASTEKSLRERTEALLQQHQLDYKLEWTLSGQPFITSHGALIEASIQAIQTTLGITPELSTAGGTSDGRFIAPSGGQVIELGPINQSIHQIDEHVKADDLDALSGLYEGIMLSLLD